MGKSGDSKATGENATEKQQGVLDKLKLSKRQLLILASWLYDLKTTREIAADLHISQSMIVKEIATAKGKFVAAGIEWKEPCYKKPSIIYVDPAALDIGLLSIDRD
jgi:DNA-binding CsgD family transcriptional regulator